MEEIKTMQLYNHCERFMAELEARKLGASFKECDICDIDSLHYLGEEAILSAIEKLDIKTDSENGINILDIGSGLGGPARSLAERIQNASVTAIELQADLHEIAQELTTRTCLTGQVKHVNADIMTSEMVSKFDYIVSWLVFLHIPAKADLYKKCAESLKPGGRIYVEDFYKRAEFTTIEDGLLKTEVYASDLSSLKQLEADLSAAGFVNIRITDMTDTWRAYVTDRVELFRKRKERNVGVHGEAAVASLQRFYDAIVTLFNGPNLGGLIWTAEKA